MMRRLALVPVVLLGACVSQSADQIARAAARSAVNPVLASRFPGLPLEPAANCVIDNASASEIVSLAASARGGVTDETARLVLDVVRRPATLQCLATDGLPVLLTTL